MLLQKIVFYDMLKLKFIRFINPGA